MARVIARIRRPLALLLTALLATSLSSVAVSAAQAASGPTLSQLTISTGSFDAPFDPAGGSSTATVPYTVTSLSFTATASDPSYTITAWDGNSTVPATSGVPIPATLRLGTNILIATVTDPATSTSLQYTLIITRSAPPAPAYDPRLSSLGVSEGALSPAFDAATTSYSVAVPYTTTSVTLTATSTDTVTFTNPSRPMTAGTTSLQVGGNLVQVTVTAVDGTTALTYDVFIVRADPPTADVDLDALQVSAGTLVPAFDPAVTSYTVSVPYAVRSMQITASPSDAANAMVINNEPMADGVPSTVTVNYNGGSGYAIRVAAPNQVEKIYTVHITREAPSTDADLTSLSLSEGTLSPAFDNAETAYTAQVPYLTTSVTVTGVLADQTAILRINNVDTASGSASSAIPLVVGANAIVVAATAEDGVTGTTRTITVTREAPDLDLASLAVVGGTLAPAFDAATTSYAVSLPYTTSSLDVSAAAVESAWTVTIDGVVSASRTIPVAVGTQNITVRVTAVHGEFRDYTITVTRAAAVAPSLAFTLGFGAGDQATGAPFDVTGDHLLPGSTFTVTAHSSPIVLVTGLVGTTGTVSWHGALPALDAGAHRLVFEGTAEDGTAVSRTAWFTVLRSGKIGAVSLTGPVAYSEAALAATGSQGTADLTVGALLALMLGGALLARSAVRARRARA